MDPVAYSVRVVPRDGAVQETPVVGHSGWAVRSLELREALDEPFWLELTMVAHDLTLDVEGLVGGAATASMDGTDVERHFSGVVVSATYLGTFDSTIHLRMVIAPALALAGLTERSRVFQALTIPEIVADVAGEHLAGGAVDTTHLRGEQHAERDYCVQYRESDLDFVRRILAEDGIAFVLRQDNEDEPATMVLLDRADAFRPTTASKDDPQPSESPLIPVATNRTEPAQSASISALEWRRSAVVANHQVREFDWMAANPGPLSGTRRNEQAASWERGNHERHLFRRTAEDGGAHRDETDRIAEILHQRAQTRSAVAVGRSNALGFSAGETFTLDGHPGENLDGNYLLTSVTHRADCPEVDVRGGGLAGPNYENHFQAIDAGTPYRPAGRPSPRAYGQQTATVIGPPGEEIHTDAHGRIQVWMHWDHKGPDEGLERTCWLRVAQPLAGPGFGTMFLPRVGMEVLVSFVDGDPDRPVCVGCLYGGANTTPYVLPDDRTKTTLKTRSSPGGDGYNELRFEDAAGSEQVFLHAQRNLDEEVLAAHTMDVGSTQSISVGSNQTISVGGGRDITVKGTQSITIDGASTAVPPGPALTRTVVGDIQTSATGSSTLIAPTGIRLVCGPTILEMTPDSITMVTGKGSMLKLDAAVLMAAAAGAMQMTMGADGKAGLVSASGAAMEIDSAVKMTSMEGAQIQLTENLQATASGGASLQLSKDARLQGGTAAVEGSGARIKLDSNADLYGAEVHAHSKNGSVRADAAGVQVQGADTKVLGTAIATVQAPIVKVN